jgi:glucose/arabinose dehydrogenase
LPDGFCATIFAEKVGHARQLAVAPDDTVYVNTWSGVYYKNDTPPPGGFLVALKDTKGTGQADVNVRFGPTFANGAHGGTGTWLYKNWLYAEINDKIVRYELKEGEVAPTVKPETILCDMPISGDHPMHPFAIDAQGNLFVSMGSATNAREVQNRMPHSPGNNPCTENRDARRDLALRDLARWIWRVGGTLEDSLGVLGQLPCSEVFQKHTGLRKCDQFFSDVGGPEIDNQ